MRSLLSPSETIHVDLAHPILHVVEGFLVLDIMDCDDVECVLAPVEHVPRDLELKRAFQHCRDLFDLVAGCHRVHDVRAEFLPLLPMSSVELFSCPGFRHVGLDTFALAIDGSQNGLIVSLTILLFLRSSHFAD